MDYIDISQVQPMIAFAAFIPLIAAAAGPILDKVFGSKERTPEQTVQSQQQASRYDVTTPYGASTWDSAGNLTKELSPQMQDMMNRKFDYRNSALSNALSWFGTPDGAQASDFAPFEGGGGGGGGKDPNMYPGRNATATEWYEWGKENGWGDNPGDWGKKGNPGIPWERVETGRFPTELTPAQLQTWWMNYGDGDFKPENTA